MTSEFISTGFGSRPEAKVESDGEVVTLGFYALDGRTYKSETMTAEAAVRIGRALDAAGARIIGHRAIGATADR